MWNNHRPTPAGVLAFLALMIALGGTALAATGQLVNITDPTTAANKAKVDATGHLVVGDGTSALTVDGTVVARDSALSTYVHVIGAGGNGPTCQVVGSPPSGKAWVIKSMNLNIVTPNDTPLGPGQHVVVYPNATCAYPYSRSLEPARLGSESWNFEPGLVIPAGGAIAVENYATNLSWQLQAEGYSTSAASVPAAPQAGPSGKGARRDSPDPAP
jgi:hypothetical protein